MKKCDNPMCRYFAGSRILGGGGGNTQPELVCLSQNYVPRVIESREGCENHKWDLVWNYFKAIGVRNEKVVNGCRSNSGINRR